MDSPGDKPEIRHGRLLKAARARKGWTQAQVADKAGISLRTYQEYEQGLYLPSGKREWKLVCILDVDLMDLVGITKADTELPTFEQEPPEYEDHMDVMYR